jgi:S-(hydroxymethyl)glutathione dehydrogenase/alcohol dehydrogenase
VDEYLAKELMVDEFISHTMPIENINEAVELIEKGEW